MTEYQKIMEECPILYCQKNLSCMETCMCWGIEAGKGWAKPIEKLSKGLEEINNIWWPIKHIRIQADQVKEKYGTLHFYYSVVIDPPAIRCFFGTMFRKIADFIERHFKFEYKTIEKAPSYEKTEITRLDFKDYQKEMNSASVSNVFYSFKDGEVFKIVRYHVSREVTRVLQNHKILNWIKEKSRQLGNKIRYSYSSSSDVQHIIDQIESKADELIKTAEHECSHCCEDCGAEIGTDESPQCMSMGWIKYICEKCAIAGNQNYQKNDAIWNNGKLVKTTEEKKLEYEKIASTYAERGKKRKELVLKAVEKAEELLNIQKEEHALH